MNLLTTAFLWMSLAAAGQPHADLYVAPNGNDAWSGTLPAPASGDGPLASLDGARRAVRRLKQSPPGRGRAILVLIRGGTYFLPETVTFTAEDSGTAAAPIIYAASPGEEPISSGGVPVTGWQSAGPGRWQAQLPEVAAGKWWFSQLYVNSQRRYRPVWPRDGYSFIEAAAGQSAVNEPAKGCLDRFRFKAGDIRDDWKNLQQVELLAIHSWAMSRIPIRAIDAARRIVTLAGPTWGSPWGDLKPGGWYRLENVAEALQQPGQWYLDRPTGLLTYLPLPGEDLARAQVIAPRLPRLLLLSGDAERGKFVDYLVFRGLTFAHNAWNVPPRGYSAPQSESPLDGAITARGARHCRLENCIVRHTATYAVDLGPGCHDDAVEGCELFDLGAGGVKIGSERRYAQRDSPQYADGCTVRDTLVAHAGRVHPAGAGIWIGNAAHNRVEHNEVVDLYQLAVSVGWQWGPGYSPAHHNTIAYNHLHDIGQGVTSDMAGIYTLGESPGTTERFNLIHDVSRARYGAWGIYFDESSAFVVAEKNVVYRTEDAPFHLHYGKENILRNNVLALGHNDQIQISQPKKSGPLTIERNLFYWREGNFLKGKPHAEVTFRDNLLWHAGAAGPLELRGAWTLDELRRHDPGLVVADPLFVDPDRGDFRLRPGSPAARIGFEPIDISTSGRLTLTARTAALPAVPRAYPPAPPIPPVVIHEDFEGLAVGQHLPGFVHMAANSQADVRVTDEAAAGGRHSLKFTDGPDGPIYFPHEYMNVHYESGTVRTAFDLRVEPGARPRFEWRDTSPWYTSGPSIEVLADGRVQSGAKILPMKIPHGQWVHVELRCALGPPAAGTYQLRLTLPGQSERLFELPLARGFQTLGWIGFSSFSRQRVVYYVDNLVLEGVKQ
jgi:hypothetical protein